MIRYDDPKSLPLLLHMNSEPWMNLDAYAAQSAEVPFPVNVPGVNCVTLPLPQAVKDNDSAFSDTISTRRSHRDFDERALPLALLSRLLAFTYGVRGMVTLPDGVRVMQRPLPSAGALYPLELHLTLSNVTGVADGVYRYEPLHHRLEPKGSLPNADELAAMMLAQPYLENANVIVIFVGRFQRTMAKYGMRGYRYLLLEAGHAAQNLCLLATEARLGTLCIGGFRDQMINRWLGLDIQQEAALYCVAVGWPFSG